MPTYFTLARPRDDVEGSTFGPFDYVHVLYSGLRAVQETPHREVELMFDVDEGEWFFVKRTPSEGAWYGVGPDTDTEPWSDITIFTADVDDPLVAKAVHG